MAKDQVLDDSSVELVDWDIFSQMRSELGASFVRILGYFREDGEKAVAEIETAMHGGDAAALVSPAHKMKSEARQLGAEPLGALAEEIEIAARHALESQIFPDHILPEVAKLRSVYVRTIFLLEQATNPLVERRPGFGKRPSNQEFGRL